MKCLVLSGFAFLLTLVSTALCGCSESYLDEEFGIDCTCDIVNESEYKVNEAPVMRMNQDGFAFEQIDTSDNCLLLTDAIVGHWEANLPTGHLRYDFNGDGHYVLYREKNGKWIRRDTGTFRIAYQQLNGLLRAALYMTGGDGIEYPTLFYVREGHLIFDAQVGDLESLEFAPYVAQ